MLLRNYSAVMFGILFPHIQVCLLFVSNFFCFTAYGTDPKLQKKLLLLFFKNLKKIRISQHTVNLVVAIRLMVY